MRELAVWLGHSESDNIARTEIGEEGSYDSVGLLLNLAKASPRFEGSFRSDLEYRSYSLEDLDNELVGQLDGSARIEAVQDRFSWLFANHLGQALTDVFAPVGPNTRENLNVFSTGPALALPVGARTSLDLNASYSTRRYDESSNVDSDSKLYEVGILHETSQTARVGIVANANEIEYTDFATFDYEIDRVSLHYEKELATGRVLADLGKNEVEFGPFTDDGPYFEFQWARAVAAHSSLNITAGRSFTDTGTLLGVATGADSTQTGTGTASDILVSPNPLEQRRLGIAYALTLSRTTVTASVGTSEDRYVGSSSLDNDATTTQLSFQHAISERLGFGAGYSEVRREFAGTAAPNLDDEDTSLSAWVTRSLARRFYVGLALSRYERTGGQRFDENRYELRFGYSPTDRAARGIGAIGR